MYYYIEPFLRRIYLFLKKNHVEYDGSILPFPGGRKCGPEFRDNSFYTQSAENEAKRLIEKMGCNNDSKILDIGSGQGRLAIGLTRVIKNIDYTGLDVDTWSVNWCKKYITKYFPSYHFIRINVKNKRYNMFGRKLSDKFQFGFPDNSFHIIYLYSVFSHMTEEDMLRYLNDFKRILKPGGQVFFTTFIEDNVENVSYNPEDYGFTHDTPLHIVRYNKNHLASLIQKTGFTLKEFSHRTEVDGQSGVYLTGNK